VLKIEVSNLITKKICGRNHYEKAFAALLSVFALVALAACGEPDLGDYKPGLHLGYTDGHQNTYAYVYVDADGYIFDIFIDTVYMKTDEDGPVTWEGRGGNEQTGYATTKMSLDDGCGYNMWPSEPVVDCEVEGEIMWHDQVRMLAEDIIENQGIIDYDLVDGDFDEDGDDVISGVTITVSGYLEAVENALDIARLGEDESPRDYDVPSFDGEGDYTPGIHFGYTEGHQNTIGIIAVNEDGHIVYAASDTIYLKTDEDGPLTWEGRGGNEQTGYATTKMSLDYGCGYNMWPAEPVEDCQVEGETMWHDQVAMVMDDIVANQGIIDYDLIDGDFDEDGDDIVSGVTITVSHYLNAIEDAISKAE